MDRLGRSRSPGARGRERFAFVAEAITERKPAEEIWPGCPAAGNVRDSVIVTDMEGIITY